MKTLFYFLVSVIAVIAAVAFTVLNPGDVDLDLYVVQFRLPLSAAIMLSMFFGVLLGFLVGLVATLSKAGEVRKLTKKLKDAQTELTNLRKLPIEEP